MKDINEFEMQPLTDQDVNEALMLFVALLQVDTDEAAEEILVSPANRFQAYMLQRLADIVSGFYGMVEQTTKLQFFAIIQGKDAQVDVELVDGQRVTLYTTEGEKNFDIFATSLPQNLDIIH